MMMEPFHIRFPKVAEKETRCIIVLEREDLPAGEYYFIESFCNDKKCDCRRAFINILYEDKVIATIGFGWEDLEFYGKWMGDKSMAKDLKGPILELTGIRTKYSEKGLALFKEFMMNDEVFIERLKKHYKMFKESLSDDDDGLDDTDDFYPDEHSITSLCDNQGTGFDFIDDKNREAFFPLMMAIEETIWDEYSKDSSLKDSKVISSLKKLRDNIFSETAEFNNLEKKIITKLKLILFTNDYNKKDLRMSISSVIKSAKRHKSMGGSRGYLRFISDFFE